MSEETGFAGYWRHYADLLRRAMRDLHDARVNPRVLIGSLEENDEAVIKCVLVVRKENDLLELRRARDLLAVVAVQLSEQIEALEAGRNRA